MKDVIPKRLGIMHKFALIANLLMEEFKIPLPLYMLFVIYETCLLMKMPVSIPTLYDSNYATFSGILSTLSYALFCLKKSAETTMIVVIVHLAISIVVPIFVIGMLFHNCMSFSNFIRSLAKSVILVGVMEYTFMLLPMGKTFWAVMLKSSKFHLSNGFRITCGIGYLCTLATAFILPILFSLNPNSKSIWAGSISFLHYGRTLIKVLITFYMALDYKLVYSWIATIVFIIPVLWYLIRSAFNNMLYLKSLYFLYTFQITLLFLSMSLFEIKKLVKSQCTVEDILNVMILTIFTSILLTLLQKNKNNQLLQLQIFKIELQAEAEEYAAAIIRLIGRPNYEITSMVIFESNYSHLEMPQDDINSIRNLMHNKSFSDDIINRKAIFSLFNSIYSKLLLVFPQSTFIKLVYSIYLWQYSGNLYKSYFIVLKSLIDQNSIHYMVIAIRLLNALRYQQHNSYKQERCEINRAIKYNCRIHKFNSLCESTANSVLNIYKLLIFNHVNPKILQSTVMLTARRLDSLTKTYSSIISMSFHIPSHNMLCCFYTLVLSNSKFLVKYSDIEERIKYNSSIVLEASTIYDYNNDTAILVVSGNEYDLESILYASHEVATIFKYMPKQLIKQSITSIMPVIFREAHRDFINAFRHTGITKIMHANQFLFGFTRQYMLIPIDIYVTTIINIAATCQYIAYIKAKGSNSIMQAVNVPRDMQSINPLIWMLTLDGEIIGMNDYSYEVLGIPKDYIEVKKGILNINAGILLPGINELLSVPSMLQQGAMLTLDTRNLFNCLDADVLDELKTPLNKSEIHEMKLYVKPTKYTFSHIEYYVLIMCTAINEHAKKCIQKTDDKIINSFSNSSISIGMEDTLPIDNKGNAIKHDKVQLIITILILLGVLALNTFYMYSNTSISRAIKWDSEAISVHTKTSLFLLNLISIFQKYIISIKTSSSTDERYLNQLLFNYSTYLEQNSKILKHKPSKYMQYYDGISDFANATMYSVLLDISEKLTYLINICDPVTLASAHLNYIAASQINDFQSLPYCLRIVYEVIVNSYQHFIISDSIVETSFDNTSMKLKQVKSGFSKSFIITIVMLFLSLMAIIIFSIRIRIFKAHLYNKLLSLPKEALHKRILLINRFSSISNDNSAITKEVAKLTRKGPEKDDFNRDYSLLIERKRFVIPPSNIEFLTIATICFLISILIVMLLMYLHFTNKFECTLEITTCYIDLRLHINEASFLYYISCFYSLPTYITNERTATQIIENAQQKLRKFKSLKYYDIYKNVLEDGVCSILSDKNSTYFTPYLNATDCGNIYHNILNQSISDVIEFYIINIGDNYQTLLLEGSCEMDEHHDELYMLYTHYLNPAMLAQIFWVNAQLMSREEVFDTLIWGYNILLILVIMFIISLVALISRDLHSTTRSLKKVLKQITR